MCSAGCRKKFIAVSNSNNNNRVSRYNHALPQRIKKYPWYTIAGLKKKNHQLPGIPPFKV